MDPRIREHAEVLVDWSARVAAGDRVIVTVDEGSIPLAVAVSAALAEREADPVTVFDSPDATRAYLRNAPGADFTEDPDHEHALYREADVLLRLRGGRNTAAMADVPAETRRAYERARGGIREARYATDWVSTVHPTPSLAQQASMATAAYRDFAYDAMLRDWASLAEEMGRLKERLDAGSTVRIEASGTDIELDIEGRSAVNSAASVAYDSHNLPSGEVFTAPATVSGTVTFDIPMTILGRPVRDVRLTFEDGTVVEAEAAEGLDVIQDVLETDPGARRLGELGIGMNRAIDRYTDNILFDEKMGGTFHLALGRAYDACVPDGQAANDSAVHVDLLADLRTESTMSIDEKVVQTDGVFAWD